jgi:hypothetical protein
VDERIRPIGALGRERLFRMFSGQFGHAVFANRPVVDIADPHPRVIDADTTIVEAAVTVANRDTDSLFDDVLVADAGGRVVGLVRVRDLLRALTSLGLDRVQQLNPLTGMPGTARAPSRPLRDHRHGRDAGRQPRRHRRLQVVQRAGRLHRRRPTIQALGHAVASVDAGAACGSSATSAATTSSWPGTTTTKRSWARSRSRWS